MISYIFGHASWDHFCGNIMFLLVLGPLIEEKYGSVEVAIYTVITAIGTAFINCFTGYSLIGASGIVFMFICMASFGRSKGKKIPITMLLVVLLYIGKEVVADFTPSNISHLGHIVGGVFGIIFATMYNLLPEPTAEVIKINMPAAKVPDMSRR